MTRRLGNVSSNVRICNRSELVEELQQKNETDKIWKIIFDLTLGIYTGRLNELENELTSAGCQSLASRVTQDVVEPHLFDIYSDDAFP